VLWRVYDCFLWYFACWKLIKNDGGKFPFYWYVLLLFCGLFCVIFSLNLYPTILVFGFDPMVIYPCSHNSSLDCVKFGGFVVFSILLKLEFCDISHVLVKIDAWLQFCDVFSSLSNLILDYNSVIFCYVVKIDSWYQFLIFCNYV